MRLEEFFLPFGGTLSADNRWVEMTKLIPFLRYYRCRFSFRPDYPGCCRYFEL